MALTDLRALQGRYDELPQIKERQDALLAKLSNRLNEASAYFAAISEHDDSQSPPEIEAVDDTKTKKQKTGKQTHHTHSQK